MRRLLALILASLLGIGPALADTTPGQSVVSVAGKKGAVTLSAGDVGAMACPGTCAEREAWLTALEQSKLGGRLYVETLYPGPLPAVVQNGGDLATWAATQLGLSGPQMIAVFQAAGAPVKPMAGAVPVTAASIGAVPTARQLTAGAGLTGGGDMTVDRVFGIAPGGVVGSMLGSGAAAANLGFTPPTTTMQLPDVGALLRDRDAKIAERVSITDFCPLNQSSSYIPCFQLAAQRMCDRTSNGFAVIDLPAADYPIDAGSTWSAPCDGIYFKGRSWGDRDNPHGTRLIVTGTGMQPLFSWAAPTKAGDRYFYGGGISDLLVKFTNPSNMILQTGAFADISKCFGCVVENVFAFNPYKFVAIHAGYRNVVDHATVNQMALGGEAFRFDGTDSGSADCAGHGIANCPTRGDVVVLRDINIDSVLPTSGQPAGTCYRFSNFAATWWILGGSICNQVNLGINVDCPDDHSIGACPQFGYGERLEFEINATGSPGTAAAIAAADFQHIEIHSLHAYGYGGPAALVKLSSAHWAQAGDFQVYGGKVENAAGPCVQSSIRDLTWIGGAVLGCGPASDGTAYGFDLRPNGVGGAASSGSAVISAVHFCNNAYAGPPTAMKGLWLEAGVDWIDASHNLFRDCLASPINDQSGGTHNVLTPNALP